MENFKYFCKYQLPAIMWALIIFVQSSISNISQPPIGISFQDKIAHIIIFGILGFLITRSLFYSKQVFLRNNAIFLGVILGILYGLSDEVHQYFVPGRFSEIWDVIADIIGVLMAQLFFLIRRFRPG